MIKLILWDHPRACGDYLYLQVPSVWQPGSPPRLRGLHPVCTQYIKSTRITPALAGTTSDVNVDVAFPQDHPRACGDYNITLILESDPKGSPPRLRGLLVLGNFDYNATGITPALAGTTSPGMSKTV